MRESIKNFLKVAGLALLTFFSGCKDKLPEVTTNPVEDITATSAKSGGKYINDGKLKVISAGVCWDTIQEPTILSNYTKDSLSREDFKMEIEKLFPDTKYYIRAFAETPAGIAYGDELSFKTLTSVPFPATSEVSEITMTTAKSGGIIYSDGGSEITETGICWDTIPLPFRSGFHKRDTTGSKEFSIEIDGLLPDRTYYVRAYSVNSLGTGYGEEKSFRTKKAAPLRSIFTITERWLYSASVNVKSITFDGEKVSDYGVCWGTKPEPTIDINKITKQYKPGRFRLRGLKAGTKYYVRLYTITRDGIHYGKEGSFTSLGRRPAAETLEAFDLTETGAKFKARVNNGFLPLTIIFEYGTTEKYGQSAKTTLPLGKGTDTIVFVTVNDLIPGTPYHFRVKATNDLGVAYGKDAISLLLVKPEIKGFNPITKNYRDTEFYINAPASNSPGDFTYVSSDSSIAVITGNSGIIKGSGTCIITATQKPSGKFASGTVTTTFSMNVVDIDGNVYQTVAIGDQDWMKENLKVTRYRNGEPIPNVTEPAKWASLTTGAFCWMNNDTANKATKYGALYNWYAVSDPRRICPTGWHVPTDAEWQVMERFLGMTFAEAEETVKRGVNQGVQIKDSTGWIKNGNGTNSSEFSGLPAGLRMAKEGDFHNIGADACWWTNTEEDAWNAWMRNMYYYYTGIYRIPDLKASGFSVRCVRDRRR